MLSIKLNRSVLPLAFSFALAVIVLTPASSAFATAGAHSSSAIDLSSLQISPGASMTLNLFEANGSSQSPIGSQYPRDYMFGPFTSIGSGYNFATTTALANSSGLNQESIASANDPGASYYANAWSVYDGFFTVTGSGNITITAGYDLFLQLFTDFPSESAFGWSSASLNIFNSSTFGFTSDVHELISATPGNYLDYTSGTLTATLPFEAGQTGSFRLIVEGEAAASVPEPATVALLGIGLFGSALLRKRIKR
jgi:hypothetical protein